MNALLTKSRLDALRRALYGANVQATFYKVTPAAGETVITTITSAFHFQREQRAGQEIDGSGVKMWLSSSALITRAQLKIGATVTLTVDGITTRYVIGDLLPMQQIGAGYVLRLKPQNGATG